MGFLHNLTDPSHHPVKISFGLFLYPHLPEDGSAAQRGWGSPKIETTETRGACCRRALSQQTRVVLAHSRVGTHCRLSLAINIFLAPSSERHPGLQPATSHSRLAWATLHPNTARLLLTSFSNLSNNLVFLQKNFLHSHQRSQGTDKQDVFRIEHKVLNSEDTDHISLKSPQLPLISRAHNLPESVVSAPLTASTSDVFAFL